MSFEDLLKLLLNGLCSGLRQPFLEFDAQKGDSLLLLGLVCEECYISFTFNMLIVIVCYLV